MKTLNIKRTKQILAFNQTINLFLDGKFCGKLMNGDKLAIDIRNNHSRLEAKSCFGSEAVVFDENDQTTNNITIQFGKSDLYFVFIISLFIIFGTTIIGLIWYANINFSFFMLIVSSFFIIRNRKQLRIIKK